MNVYALYDKVAKRHLAISFAASDDDYVRQSLYPTLMDYPLRDVEYYQIGTFDLETGKITPCDRRLCSWEAYKFPKTRMSNDGDDVSLSEIEEHAQKTKAELVAKSAKESS